MRNTPCWEVREVHYLFGAGWQARIEEPIGGRITWEFKTQGIVQGLHSSTVQQGHTRSVRAAKQTIEVLVSKLEADEISEASHD